MSKTNLRRFAGAAALLLWSVSLLVPAMHFCAQYPDAELPRFSEHGLWFLFSGLPGLFLGWFGWLANPLLLVIIFFLLSAVRPWLVFSAACLSLAATVFLQNGGAIDFDGGPYRTCGYAPGFWLWLTACAVPLVEGLTEALILRRAEPLQE